MDLKDFTLLAHATFGALGCLTAFWTFVETLHAKPENARRIQFAALSTTLCMAAAWIFGGYFYVNFYPAEKAMILAGPWPQAHNFFMEVKEHLFFITAILALFLPIAARENLSTVVARKLVLCVAALIVITGLAAEGGGAIIDHSVKLSLLLHQPK